MTHIASIMFGLLVLVSILLMGASPTIYISWLFLEMNLLFFIPFLTGASAYKVEGALNYFFIQVLASSIILMCWINYSVVAPVLEGHKGILVALSVKMGLGPFHYWLVGMSSSVSSTVLFFLLTVQKICPLMMLFYTVDLVLAGTLVKVMAVFTAMVGCTSGFNQTSLKKLLVYSSVGQMGWVYLSMCTSWTVTVVFFSLYSLVVGAAIVMMVSSQVFLIMDLWNTKKSNVLSMYICFTSMAGMPPLSGFIPKLLVIQCASGDGVELVIGLLLVSVLVSFFFYSRMFMSALVWPEHPNFNIMSSLSDLPVIMSFLGVLAPAALSQI